MKRFNVLDLCSGAGGTAMGLHMGGKFAFVGVDNVPQPRYPFTFRQDDIMDILKNRMDVVTQWADFVSVAPPCQGYSTTKSLHDNYYPLLISEVRELLEPTGIPYMIENVEGARWDMKNPIMLCGSSFGLRVRRHRLFESNIPLVGKPCEHRWQNEHQPYRIHMSKGRYPEGYRMSGVNGVHGSGQVHPSMPRHDGSGPNKSLFYKAVAMGIDWMTQEEINEAIPPVYTKYLGAQIYEYLTEKSQ